MLRACRRVLRPGGRIAFTTIEPAAGLSAAERRRARRVGPSAVLVRTGYASLLASAGFVDIERHDLTAEYRETQRAWIEATRRLAPALRPTMGAGEFDRRLAERDAALAATDAGLLARTRYVAAALR